MLSCSRCVHVHAPCPVMLCSCAQCGAGARGHVRGLASAVVVGAVTCEKGIYRTSMFEDFNFT